MAVVTSCHGDKTTDLHNFTHKAYTPRYASGFDIRSDGADSAVLITVTDPWQGADSVSLQLLVTRGVKAPEGFDGQILADNARRIICMSSTHVAMLDALGAVDRVVGVSGIGFISNPYVQAHRDSIADVGYEGNINYEALIAAEPDLVLLYGVNGASPMQDRLRELGIPYMYIGEYVEQSPLGKSEWLMAVAEVCGLREKGRQVFDDIAGRYNSLRDSVAAASAPAPAVMLNTPYNDTWFMPSTQSYFARLLKDAGGRYVYTKNTGNTSQPVDIEQAYVLASQADVWLNVDNCPDLASLRATYPRFADVPPVRNGRVYGANRRVTSAGGNDFYESAVVHPDVVLADLVSILHPDMSVPPVYYRALE